MGSDPKTEAGPRTALLDAAQDAIDLLSSAHIGMVGPDEPDATIDALRRAIEEEAARLVSPADREGQVAGIAELLHDLEATQHFVRHEPADGYVTDEPTEVIECVTGERGHDEDAAQLYRAGLRLGQREDAPLDAERSWYDQGWRDGQAVALSPNSLRRTFASVNRELLPTDPGFWETVVQRLRESKP